MYLAQTRVITVTNINSWAAGDVVEFITGEQAYIKSIDVDNSRFTVARAWNSYRSNCNRPNRN